jgi:phage repressor protein C with HTH and peptisase S24 domain
MSVKCRIKEFVKSVGLTVSDFEKSISTSNGYVNSISKSIGIDKIELILEKYPTLNLEWLLTGQGKMLKRVGSDDALPAVPADGRETAYGMKPVYLYDVSAAAGYGSFDEMISAEKIIDRYLVPCFKDIDWMIFVRGASMYPKYSSGDIIACRVLHESRFIQWGKVYVIATREQGILVKRLRRCADDNCITAISDNRTYDSFDIPKDEILGLALVVGVIRLE